jgi:hypothetical protein
MAKKRGKYEPPMFLDMPFGQALRRFIGTDPAEVDANIKRSKKKKVPGGKKRKSPPGVTGDSQNVVSLRDRRTRKRNYGS